MRLLTAILALSIALSAAELSFAQPSVVEIDLRIGTYKGGYSRGEKSARRHLKDGKLRLITFGGLPVPGHEGFDSALAKVYAQHGVELTMDGACTSPEDERGYIAGYNSVVVAELERRFGKNFIARVESEADALTKRALK
jgi:hypothetical protein